MSSSDALRKIFSAYAAGFKPPEKISPVEWCEKHVESIPYSPIPGRFYGVNSPQILEVLSSIVSPLVQTVVIQAAVQTGKTLGAELALAWIIANDPGPCIWLAAKDDEAKKHFESRLYPLFESCEPVKALFPNDKYKKRGDTCIFRNGMFLWGFGARNKRNLQSRSVRWVFADEAWQYPQGHLAEAEARLSAFGNFGKFVVMSQGSFHGDDFDKKFNQTDRREWCFTCPKCGEVQPFAFENLKFSGDKNERGEYNMEAVASSARLYCRQCGNAFENTAGTRSALNAGAKFIPQNPQAVPGCVGFHWNALAFMDWGKIAVEFLAAKQRARAGRIEDLQAFYQKRLGVAWKDQDDFSTKEIFADAAKLQQSGYKIGQCDWQDEGVADFAARIFRRACEFPQGTPPQDAPRLRFLTIDVQHGYFYWVVRAWSPGGDSRLYACGLAQTFPDLEEVCQKFNILPRATFIDGGFATQRVCDWAGNKGATVLFGDRSGKGAFRHSDGKERAFSPVRRISIGGEHFARGFYFSQLTCKDKLADLRRGEAQRWELPQDIPENYLRQMLAEERQLVNGKPIWLNKAGRDNHYFDCETMQVCAAFMNGLF